MIGNMGALSLTSFKCTVTDMGALAAAPLFSRATTWNLNLPGLGGSRSRLFSLTRRWPFLSMMKKGVVSSKT
ncbi:hypothetical protein MTP99_003482 [Tenebrio molitor]|nr:hypothetical protein MTP99_003482 [Tenebrio molitor]